MSGPKRWHKNKEVPSIAKMMASGSYLHERHAYLARKILLGDELQRCYCGEHLDEKAELARYTRKVAGDKERESKKERVERLIKEFNSLSAEEKEKLLCQAELFE